MNRTSRNTFLHGRSRLAWCLALLACGLFLTACGDGEGDGKTEEADEPAPVDGVSVPGATPRPPPETVIITVNGTPIKQAEVDKAVFARSRQSGRELEPEELEIMRQRMSPQIEQELIRNRLLEQAAAKEGFTASKEEADARVEEFAKRLPKDKDIDSYLAGLGTTREEATAELRRGMAVEKLLKKKGTELAEPSEADARIYYKRRLREIQIPDRIRARHILLKVEKSASDADKEATRKKLETHRERLAKGEGDDFETTAAAISDCPSKEQGGDLGMFGKGQMVPPFEKVAFGLETGVISPVVETQFGFHIIRVEEIKKGRTPPFDEVKDELMARMRTEGRDAAVRKYIEGLHAAAKIERPNTP